MGMGMGLGSSSSFDNGSSNWCSRCQGKEVCTMLQYLLIQFIKKGFICQNKRNFLI